ncbi:hypothetical protein [Aeromonas veronii]
MEISLITAATEHLTALSPVMNILNSKYFEALQAKTQLEEAERSMIKRNKIIFDRLKEQASANGYSAFHDAICISTHNEETKNWLKTISSSQTELSTQFEENTFKLKDAFSITTFFYNNEKYIFISGVESLTLSSNWFEVIENNAGILTLFLSLNLIPFVNKSSDVGKIYDTILFLDDELNGPRYIEKEDIESFLSNYCVFKIKNESNFINFDLYRLASYISLCLRRDFYVNVDLELTDSLEHLINDGDRNINFINFAKSVYIIDEPYILFMELYRMLERLYAIPTLRVLQGKLSLRGQCLWNISKELEQTTGWRKNEKEGLISLLDSLNVSQLFDMCTTIKTGSLKDFSIENVEYKKTIFEAATSDDHRKIVVENEYKRAMISVLSNYIYQVRNSHVHYRENLNTYLSDDELRILCKAMLTAINPIYINTL